MNEKDNQRAFRAAANTFDPGPGPGPSPVPVNRGVIQEDIESLRSMQEAALELLYELHRRLIPVMGPSQPEKANDPVPDNPEPTISQLVRDARDRASYQRSLIEAMIDRLQV